MGIPRIIDTVVRPHGNRHGMSLGWLTTTWLTYILSESDHRMCEVEGWAEVDESEAIDLELRGGTVVLFLANLLHGAYDNRSNRTRFGTAWHYVPGDLELERFPRGEYEDRHILRGH